MTEERTAKFNNSIRVNLKDRERERERGREEERGSQNSRSSYYTTRETESSEASVQHDFRGLLL